MALFSASESVYLSSFLSTVDLDSSVNNDGSIDPGLADQIPHIRGSEALTKATKDLMSLEQPPRPQSTGRSSHLHINTTRSPPPSYWPSLPPGEQPAASSSAQGPYPPTVHPNARSPSPAHHFSRALSGNTSLDPLRSNLSDERSNTSVFTSHLTHHHPSQFALGDGHDAPLSAPTPPTGLALPPISTAGFQNGQLHPHGGGTRPPPPPPPPPAGPSTKRARPASSQPATDPSSSKRPRPSPSSASPSSFAAGPGTSSGPDSGSRPAGAASGARARHATGASTASTASASAAAAAARRRDGSTSRDRLKDEQDGGGGVPDKEEAGGSTHGAGAGAAAPKGALLSPSQKRANHIQSEQKRRANIRRGYEALCEAVPALRDAIRAEEERERAEEDEAASSKGKGRSGGGGGGSGGGGADRSKKKRKSEGERADGRAGPRSENVVLQKSIDYITALLAERDTLAQRLQVARGALPLGHPAALVDPRHLDAQGAPLWEREWNGGMDLDLGGGDDGSEDEG
ncbi:hypothetical protein BC628DRAFT_1335094 [Trametes gibbosa]|nr:hypothetical protein BC628DRAFT_1335094 [Trametes gibbosa]